MAAGLPKNWSPAQRAFHKFLDWLDGGVDSGGENYLELRRRLVRFFDRKNCLSPDELADETLNRVASRLAEEGVPTDTVPARYCYIAARFVFLEYQRQPWRKQVSLDEPSASGPLVSRIAAPASTEDAAQGKLLDCLERCLETLKPDQRDLVIEYYRGQQREKIEHRRDLAARLGVTMNALSIRACRLRERLEECVRTCLAEKDTVPGSGLKKER